MPAYRLEVDQLVVWVGQNHLELNVLKTVEMKMDPHPMYFLHELREFNLPLELLAIF